MRNAEPYCSQPAPAPVEPPQTNTLPFIAAADITTCKPLVVVNSYLYSWRDKNKKGDFHFRFGGIVY